MGSGTVAQDGGGRCGSFDPLGHGGKGAEELAAAVVKASERPAHFKHLYELSWPIRKKIETIATCMYGAAGVTFEPEAEIAKSKQQRRWGMVACLSVWQKLLCRCHTILG